MWISGGIDMDTYILTEDKNFKTFWKESYAIALDSCYSFTEKKLNMELNNRLNKYLKI